MRILERSGPWLLLCRRSLTGLVLAYVLTCLVLGGTRAAWPVFYILCGSWLLVAFVGRSQLSRPAGRGLAFLDLLSFNLVLTLVLAELSLRALAIHSGRSPMLSDALDDYRLMP